MTSITTTKERTEKYWLAWLILFKKSVDRTGNAMLAHMGIAVTIIMAGLTIAFSSVIALYAFAYNDATVSGVALLGTAFVWYTALDGLSKDNRGAIVGYMFYLSAFVPVAVVAVALGASSQVVLWLMLAYLMPVLLASVVLYAILNFLGWAADMIADAITGQKDEGEKPVRVAPALVLLWRRVWSKPS